MRFAILIFLLAFLVSLVSYAAFSGEALAGNIHLVNLDAPTASLESTPAISGAQAPATGNGLLVISPAATGIAIILPIALGLVGFLGTLGALKCFGCGRRR